MPAPYRHVTQVESYQARVREGLLRLEIAPRHVLLEIEGKLSLSIHEQFLTWIAHPPERVGWRKWIPRKKDPKPKKRSVRLDEGRLLIASSHLTDVLSIWFEEKEGVYRCLLRIEPVILLDAAALQAWKALEELGKRLSAATSKYARDALVATEYGKGAHTALVVDYKHHSQVIARPVFRERHIPVFEVHGSGKVKNLKGKGQEGLCVSRYSVTLSGDRIRFDQVDGSRAAELHLPWVSPEDRKHIRVRFQDTVDGAHERMLDDALFLDDSDEEDSEQLLGELAEAT
ncbi:MAG: hypothetical protein KJO07_05500 [Deltaproteobacteria bacterium]|nr:hypothetical protein [Deltaproteobacteria bacterium]